MQQEARKIAKSGKVGLKAIIYLSLNIAPNVEFDFSVIRP